MKIIAVLNKDGGTFRKIDMAAYSQRLVQVFKNHGHEIECRIVSGQDITDALDEAAHDKGLDAIIAGGGDGTISAAARIAWENKVALGVIPAGTMNLFARSLGYPLDIWQALEVLAKGKVIEVDIASANGRPFVHQFSAGLHARMIRYRNSMRFGSKLGKIGASIRAAISVILNPPIFDVEFTTKGETKHHLASAIFVANNHFGSNSLMFSDDLTGGHLGFYITDALPPRGVAKLALYILRGKLRDNDAVTVMSLHEVELHFPVKRHDVKCVIDGELLDMPRDVKIKIHAGELKVLAPNPQQ